MHALNIKTSYRFVAIGTLAILAITVQSASAALPSGFETEVVADGLFLPVAAEFASDGRIFIAEKSGTVRVHKDGAVLGTPFITLTDINDYGDRGLLGIALDPDFATNGYVYLLYTYENTPGVNYEGVKTARLIRVTASGDTAMPGSEVTILGTVVGDVASPSCEDFPAGTDCIASDGSSHTIADLAFGPDGKLYVSIGDASSFDVVDPLAHRALDLTKLNGKVLRINSDGTAPSDNPFYNGDPTANISKVWNYGLRNPFRFGFRPANGSLYVGDVGWFSYEEVNIGIAGANFGWPCREGLFPTPGYNCSTAGYVDALYPYGHDANSAGSVTGGIFYDGSLYPGEYVDTYFFGDFAQDWIKRLVVDANDNLISVEDFMDGAGGPVEFVADLDGNINYISIYTGELRRITFTTGNRDPIPVLAATPVAGLTPLEVTFLSTGSSDPDGDTMAFLWDFGDGATSTDTNPIHTYTVDGSYTVTLTVSDGLGGMGVETADIIAGNELPTATILTPPTNSFYSVSQFIPLTASGIDPEDGMLADPAFSWRMILHHNIHIHILQTLSGPSTGFIGPDHGPDPDVYIEAELTVTDSVGLTDTVSIDLLLAPPAAVEPYHVQTTVDPTDNPINEPLTITTLIGNTGAPDPILIDIEVLDASNQKVAQFFYDEEIISTDTTATYTLEWTPTEAGTYRVAVGLIHAGWLGLYEWTNNALQFTVTEPWVSESPNGALDFDGVDDYVNTEVWDIEELEGFTLESRFVADSFNGDTHFIAKASGTTTTDYDWAFGLREISPTEAELLYIVRAGGALVELTGGTVALGEFVHASAVYDNNTMEIYKNGVSVASTTQIGLVSTSTNPVWLGNVPEDPTAGVFEGMFDEIRVWNEPQSASEIAAFQGELTQKEFGLIKDWRFNEGFGQVTIDSSNSGHHGNLGSTTSTDVNDPAFVAGTYIGGGTFIPTHVVTVAVPNPVATDTPTDITTTIENTGDGAGFMIVDIEIFDSTETQVYQEVFDGEGFSPGETRDFTAEWTPLAEGEYRVEVGLAHLFWEDIYGWVGDAATITVDNTATNTVPVITVLGDNPMGLTVGDPFVDPGATALDAEDGDITGSIVIGGDVVDTSIAGSYVITYNVTDLEGLPAPEETRTVNVISSGPLTPAHSGTVVTPDPSSTGEEVTVTTDIINIGGAGSMLVNIEVYDAGVKVAQEIYDNEPFGAGETKQFTLNYTATHTGDYGVAVGLFEPGWVSMYEWLGETAVFSVEDSIPPTNTAPNITLLGDNPMALVAGDLFVDPGATASDTEDGDITASIVTGGDIVDTSTVGSYVVTYNVNDSGGLPATEVIRTVNVSDGDPPPPAPTSTPIYLDELALGWVSWSWDTILDFANTTTIFEGANAIEATFTALWGGIYLHNDAVDTTGHTSLSFAISGGPTGGQGLQIRPYDASNAELPAVSLAGYIPGGAPSLGTWDDISIPLADLSIAETTFTGFVIQGNTGSIEDTFYLDDIRLE